MTAAATNNFVQNLVWLLQGHPAAARTLVCGSYRLAMYFVTGYTVKTN